MKKSAILAILLFFLAFNSYSQTEQTTTLSKEELLEKSNRNRSTGKTLLIAGGAAFGLGVILAASNPFDDTSAVTGVTLMALGLGSALASTFFYNAAKDQKNQAAQLSLVNEPLKPFGNSERITEPLPSLRLTIPLN